MVTPSWKGILCALLCLTASIFVQQQLAIEDSPSAADESTLHWRDRFRFRDWFNRKLVQLLVEGQNIRQQLPLPYLDDSVEVISIGERYKGFQPDQAGIATAYLAKDDPVSERDGKSALRYWIVRRATSFVLRLKCIWSLSFWYTDPWTGKGTPSAENLERIRRFPKRPDDFKMVADTLAGILTRGPFSIYSKIEKDSGDVVLDLSCFDYEKPRRPFVNVGGVARVQQNTDGTFTTKSIEFAGTLYMYDPDSDEWNLIQKRFLVALNTYATFIDHLMTCHIMGAGSNALANFVALPADHVLRIMMQPFITETTKVNNKLIDGLIKRDRSNVPSYTGYPLDTINKIGKNVIEVFDVRRLDPVWRFGDANILDNPSFPTVQSVVEVFNIYRNFTESWCKETMHGIIDEETKHYIKTLEKLVPNGVLSLVGITDLEEQLTISHVAHIAAVFMFTGSVWHHIVNDLTGAYFLSFDMMPPAIDEQGNPSRGVVLEKRNSVVAASSYRYYLVPQAGSVCMHCAERDFKLNQEGTASTSGMEKIWNQFTKDLKAYGEGGQPEEEKKYRIHPYDITSSIHA